MSKERVAEISRLRREGKTHKQIAEEVGCHTETVRITLKKLRVKNSIT